MGFFDFFRKKEKVKEEGIEHVKLEDVEGWIEAALGPFRKELDGLVGGKINQILSISSELDQKLIHKLRESKLKNPNISEREKQFMEGNREYYVKAVMQLLPKVELRGVDVKELLGRIEEAEKSLDQFGKTSMRSYHILQEFFSHEVQGIAAKLREISVSLKELKGVLDKSPVFRVKEVSKRIDSLMKDVNRKKRCQDALKNNHDVLVSYENGLKKQKDKLRELKKGKEYQEYVVLQSEYEKAQQSLKKVEQEIVEFFFPLQKALKKYSRMSLEDEKMVLSYAEEPVKAFELDSESRIMFILQNVKKEIEKGSIDLIGKKKGKAIERIGEGTPKKFEMFSKSLGDLRGGLQRIEEEIEKNRFEERERSLQYTINDVKERIEKVRQEDKRISEETALLRIERGKARVEEEINKMFLRKVVVEV